MTLPTLQDYLEGATRWHGKHEGVHYEICHHSANMKRLFGEESFGIWNFYIYIVESQAEDFHKFDCPQEIKKFTEESKHFHVTYDYYSIPDMGFPGGITFYEQEPHFDQLTGGYCKKIKVGCDYNHIWDIERGNPEDLESITSDVKRLIDKYIDAGYKLSKEQRELKQIEAIKGESNG